MQFRAGILYVVLFVVIAAGAYGVIATADAPEVTVDEADADYILGLHDEFDVDGQTFNVTELSDGSGTVQHVDETATLSQTWDDGALIMIEEDREYVLMIVEPTEGDADEEEDETDDGPTSFILYEDFDDDEYETVERDGTLYVVVTEDDTEELVHITDFDEIDSGEFEVGDTFEFYDQELEMTVDAEVTSIGEETVTVEYTGPEVTEHQLDHTETVTLNDQEFGVYFPSDDEVYLTSDMDSFQAQHDEIERHNDRITGFWWAVALSGFAAVLIAGLAYMPIRN